MLPQLGVSPSSTPRYPGARLITGPRAAVGFNVLGSRANVAVEALKESEAHQQPELGHIPRERGRSLRAPQQRIYLQGGERGWI